MTFFRKISILNCLQAEAAPGSRARILKPKLFPKPGEIRRAYSSFLAQAKANTGGMGLDRATLCLVGLAGRRHAALGIRSPGKSAPAEQNCHNPCVFKGYMDI